MKKWFLLAGVLLFFGCSSNQEEDDEVLITQPVTNNPLIIPKHDSGGISGLPSGRPNHNR